MEVFRPELHVFPLRAYLDATREVIGAEALEDMLRPYGISTRQLEDPNAWVSVEFAEAFLSDMVERCKDPNHLLRATQMGMTQKYMGILLPLFRILGNPLFTFQQQGKAAARYNKSGTWTFDDGRPGFARVTFHGSPAIRSQGGAHICKVREIQLGLVPQLFGRLPGIVEHPLCTLRGDAACTYEITWNEPPKRRDASIGMIVGGAAGVSLASLWALPFAAAVASVVGFVIGGWALGRLRIVRGELASRVEEVTEHNEALDKLARANEQRYAELLEAKAEVEKKVEERTAALSLTTEQLSKTLTQVRELDRAKTNFFSNVSHDLRTPLTLIIGPLAEMAAGREPPGGTAHAVDVMQRNGSRLLNLINQLLDLAKIDDGKMQIARNPTDVLDLARNVEARFSAAAEQKGLRLETQGIALPQIAIDSTWIETALTNLVANAMRFAKSHVFIKVGDESGTVVLEVEDDGVGIAAADIGNVFDRFAQGSDSEARKGGTGLGLAIVREAARLHGGDASVRSDPGVATTFTLTLPRAMSANAAGESLRAPAREATPAPNGSVGSNGLTPLVLTSSDVATRPMQDRVDWPGPDPTAPLVVVVEDDDDLRGFTSDVLSARYRVHATRNGEEGLAAVIELRPEAVVSDVVMPVMDGYQLCRRLRARDDTRTLPVILLTARRDVGRVLEGFEAGADDYLPKPFQARELLARVSVHVRLRQVVSEMAHRERLASLGVLAASLAHQVRNPLNSIMAGLPAVRRKLGKVLQERDNEVFGAMIDSAERINTLIADLMDLSRVDNDSVSSFKPSVGVQACIRLIDARDPGAVHIETEIDDAIELEGKAGDMNHVFLNVIDNAVRAARVGGRVKISAKRRNGSFVFEVGDSGAGVPPDKVEAVFAPFFTTRQAGEGTGLGLAIARQVVFQHGGTISVGRSELGGALFTVELPTSS